MSILTNLSNLLAREKTRIKTVVANVERVLNPVTEFTRANPLIAGLTAGTAAGTGTSLIISAVRKRSTKKSKRKRATSTRRRKSRTRTKSKHRKRKKKRNPRQRIRRTKNGQPYIILASGKARFISKKSAKTRKKRKGGYY